MRSALLLLATPLLLAQATPRAFVGATLLNPGRPPVADAVVVVQDGRIVAAGPARKVKIPEGAQRIDVQGKWITPGLVDAHVHFFQSGGLYTRPDVVDLRTHRSYETEQALIRRDLPDTFRRTLRCGITTVIDMGGPDWNFQVRDLAARTALAPRVWTSGPLLAPATIQNFRTGGSHFLTEGKDPAVRHGMTPEEARQEVRRQAALKTDFIKIWVSRATTTHTQKAIYDEAKRLGLKVAVHATRLLEATEAVKAGADILVHGVTDAVMPDTLIQDLKRRGIVVIPTLLVNRGYAQLKSRRFTFDPWEYELADPHVMGTAWDLFQVGQPLTEAQARAIQDAKAWAPAPEALENLRRLVKAGVTVATGTDAGNPFTFHGPSLFSELRLMAEAGLTPAELLACTTLNGARVLGRDKELGSVEPGKVADLLVLDGDPTLDIQHLRRLHRVVKGGEVYTPEQIHTPTPADVVQRQVNAYNARDPKAFGATYAPDVEIRTLPETTVTTQGREALEAKWGAMFQRKPDHAVRITSRQTDGPFVIDQELMLHRWLPETRHAGTAIYEVKDGLIRSVWFLKAR